MPTWNKLYFVVSVTGALTLSVYGGISLWKGLMAYALGYALMLVILSPLIILWGYKTFFPDVPKQDNKIEGGGKQP